MKVTNVLFEVGLEEMPARFLEDADKQLKQKTSEWLESIRLSYQKMKTYVTPRRLAVVIEDVATKQPDIEDEAKGPAKKIALDQEGNWSKAAIGFSKGQGKSVDDIYFKELNGIEYAYVNKFIEGKHASELLPGFKDVVLAMHFPKNMRWSTGSLRFVRPIRWLVGLNNDEIIPFDIAGVNSSNYTYGHRFLGSKVHLTDASSYEKTLREQHVIVSTAERRAMIVDQLSALEQENNWTIPQDQQLLEEVCHLVEFPTVFSGSFSKEFLKVPDEALITSMQEHQRYFPVLDQNKHLLPHFVAVRNGDDRHLDVVTRGNEKVLRARLADAMFFYQEDQKQSIEHYLKRLERMVFQENLGTIADKVNRVVAIAEKIAQFIQLDETTVQSVKRAAEISKFDLVTNMVKEFTNLQGIMGEKYALLAGETEEVAIAINEHYMPRHANDQLPKTIIGSILSVADKLDTIVGCIGVGIIPSGSQDPYALRRQALGVLQVVRNQNWQLTMEDLLTLVQDTHYALDLPSDSQTVVEKNVQDFFKARMAYIMKEIEIEQDVIEAVLVNGMGVLNTTIKRAQYLATQRSNPAFKPIQGALVRVINLAKKGEDSGVDPELFENNQEQRLYNAYLEISPIYHNRLETNQIEPAMEKLSELVSPIEDFFEDTMVMVDQEQVRANRLSLLNKIANLTVSFGDLSKVEWKQQFTS